MITGILAFWAIAFQQAEAPSSRPVEPAARRVEFAPGVVVDFERLQVEVAAKVVLREGPLELLVCSPRTREHESILVISARPLHVFQGLGLIGLQPGRPPSYDPDGERWIPAAGQPLRIEVGFDDHGVRRMADLWDWTIDARTKTRPARRDWVFCGSRKGEDGVFEADREGTVVCVVDFDTALIALAELHTSSNDELWLLANPEAIPPEGTPCTLVIRAAEQTTDRPQSRPAATQAVRREGS